MYCYWLDAVVSVSSTGAADVRLYATPALPLIANWHIPLQNFPQVDIWAGLFYCVLPFFLLVTSRLQLVTHLSEHWPSAQAQ